MPKSSIIKQSTDGVLFPTGKLTFVTVAFLWESSKPMLDSAASPIRFDLKSVTQSDSAGVALLIAWVRYARTQNKETHLMNLPEQMQAIIKVSGLNEVLPVHPGPIEGNHG